MIKLAGELEKGFTDEGISKIEKWKLKRLNDMIERFNIRTLER
jgi:hypothetical protein